MQNYYLRKKTSEIIIFGKLQISRVIPWKSISFLDILRRQNASKIAKDNSQGIIFARISCQRVLWFEIIAIFALNWSCPDTLCLKSSISCNLSLTYLSFTSLRILCMIGRALCPLALPPLPAVAMPAVATEQRDTDRRGLRPWWHHCDCDFAIWASESQSLLRRVLGILLMGWCVQGLLSAISDSAGPSRSTSWCCRQEQLRCSLKDPEEGKNWCAKLWAFFLFAKYSAEKTKMRWCVSTCQPRRWAKLTLNRR